MSDPIDVRDPLTMTAEEFAEWKEQMNDTAGSEDDSLLDSEAAQALAATTALQEINAPSDALLQAESQSSLALAEAGALADDIAVNADDPRFAVSGDDPRQSRTDELLQQIVDQLSREPERKPWYRQKNIGFVLMLLTFAISLYGLWTLYESSVKTRIVKRRADRKSVSPSRVSARAEQPEIPPGLDAVFETIAETWVQLDETALWKKLSNYIDQFHLPIGDQCVLFQEFKYWSTLDATYQCKASDFADLVDTLVASFRSGGNQFAALYQELPTLRLHGQPLPRTIAFSCAQRALAQIWGNSSRR